MAEGGGGGGRAEDSKRPSISLPPHSAVESLFRGGQVEASPGPMTLVSSFFAEDPDAECRSFSQLLAGAMASPPAAVPRKFPAEDEGRTTATRSSEEAAANGRRGGGSLNLGHSRPMNLLVAQSPFFTVPPGFSPGGLLESPSMFSSNLGNFALLHQQAQPAQATHSHVQMHNQAEKASSLSLASMVQTSGAMMEKPRIQNMNQVTNGHDYNTFVASDIRYQSASIIVDKPADDGYNWRKYGQKQVKGSEFPRSYYKCTFPNCPVKKKVERSLDGQVTEIIYKGKHNHSKPQSCKRAKEGNMSSGSPELYGNANFSINSETHMLGDPSNDNTSVPRRDRECTYGASEQLSGSSDDENGGLDEAEGCGEADQKKRNLETRVIESASHRTVTEPRIIVQTTSEVDLLDDGYKWRKYGQKVVKGNPHPRSYYKCTSAGCNVRKHVERASSDPRAVITTYEGKHNHNVPVARSSSHNTATAAAANSRPQNSISTDQNIQRSSVRRPVPILQLKEENQIS